MQQIQITDKRELLYEAPSMRKIVADVKLFAPTDLPVLITGANGTGKENIARLVHSHSKRSNEPFIAINCAAISPGLIESELFGHEKGSFTGASAKRIGAFEQAKNGTIFLDEIGEMPAEMQAKLLRVLEDGEFSRVGGNETVTACPRIISATNRDIEQAVKDGKLREDLYYRLRGTQVELPDLKDRTPDIPMLARHYASKIAVQYDLPPIDFSKDALIALKNYAWPGNVRELKNRITEASIRASQDGGIITADMLRLTPQSDIEKSMSKDGTPVKDSFGYKISMHREERGWTQKQLAQRINLKSGSTYDDNDVKRWEANFELPNSDTLAALSYLLIINNPNVAQKDKAEMVHDFMDRAQKSDYVQGIGETLQEQDNFGRMMSSLREGLGLTATELAKRATELNATTYLNWDDIYLIENSHPDSKLGSKEVLALVKALDDPYMPLPEQEKIDLYNAAKKAFTKNPQKLETMSTARRVVRESHLPKEADNDNIERANELKQQLRDMFVKQDGTPLTLGEIAEQANLSPPIISKLMGESRTEDTIIQKVSSTLSDNTLIKLEGLLHKLQKSDDVDKLQATFDELRGVTGHRSWSGNSPRKGNQIG